MEDNDIFMGRLSHDNLENEIISQIYCNDFFSTTDILDLENEILYKYISKEILTGQEEWFYSPKKDTYYYKQFNKAIDPDNNLKMMCNYFRHTKKNNLEWGEFQSGDNEEIHFKYDNNKNNVKRFKEWIKEKFDEGKPVEVYFVLKYPNILCKRFTYDSNPRFRKFKGVNYTFIPHEGGLSANFSSEKSIYYNTNNIYMRDIKH